MQEKVYKHHVKDISELRESIVATWDELDQRIIDTAVGQWRTRLRACAKAFVDISSTKCDLLYHISCTYVVAKYGDINTNGYWTV